jgi:hypothetical protein
MNCIECELGLVWLIGAFVIGLSFGACVGTVVAGLCRTAAVRTPPHIPTGPVSLEAIDRLRLDVEDWYDRSIKTLNGMRRNVGGRS